MIRTSAHATKTTRNAGMRSQPILRRAEGLNCCPSVAFRIARPIERMIAAGRGARSLFPGAHCAPDTSEQPRRLLLPQPAGFSGARIAGSKQALHRVSGAATSARVPLSVGLISTCSQTAPWRFLFSYVFLDDPRPHLLINGKFGLRHLALFLAS